MASGGRGGAGNKFAVNVGIRGATSAGGVWIGVWDGAGLTGLFCHWLPMLVFVRRFMKVLLLGFVIDMVDVGRTGAEK